MQLFELVSTRLFRPLAGPNRAFYAELLLLLWEECRHTADYSISRAEAVSRAEDYFAALAKPLALDADDAGDEAEQPTRDPPHPGAGFPAAAAAHRLAGRAARQLRGRTGPCLCAGGHAAAGSAGRDPEPPCGHLHRQAVQSMAAAPDRGGGEEPLRERPPGGGLGSGSAEPVAPGPERFHRPLHRPPDPEPHPAGGAGTVRPV